MGRSIAGECRQLEAPSDDSYAQLFLGGAPGYITIIINDKKKKKKSTTNTIDRGTRACGACHVWAHSF